MPTQHRTLLHVALIVSFLSSESLGAKPAEERARREALQAQTDRVTKVLRGESLGSTLDRSRSLDALLNEEHVSDAARWQAGYVRQGDRWVRYDKIDFPSQYEAVRQEYVEQRGKFWGNDEEHLALARWCAEKGLTDQARAHLMTVLLNHPDNPQLRALLGYQRIGGQWMNVEEYQSLMQDGQRVQARLQEWTPRIVAIRNDLTSPNPILRQRGQANLSKISEVDAVPALEAVLMSHSRDCARLCIERLSEIPHRDATLALCLAGISSPWIEVKLQAVDAVKTRPVDDYVLPLLLQTRTEYQLSFALHVGPPQRMTGQLSPVDLKVVAISESPFANDIVRSSTHFHFRPNVIGRWNNDEMFKGLTLRSSNLANNQLSKSIASAEVSNALLSQVRVTQKNNESTVKQNAAIFEFLRQTTGQKYADIPQDWWVWLNAHLDVDTPVRMNRVVDATRVEIVEVQIEPVTEVSWINFIPRSCFTAETPVWSEYGPRPIASLRVGDRVLSKDVESGELTYRSILRTTYRETERPLTRLTLAGEPITATGGHLFWVSGTGWVRARDLKPGQLVHTVTGTVRVDAVEEVPTEPTFNLVVDGFHTYFVGDGKALCHDVSLASPTDAVVPGLIER